jgi:NifB/MoaA-like Fe-S oxidoreductase
VRVGNLVVRVVPIANEWFGKSIGVAGLLTGQDIQAQLAGRALGDEVLVPATALRDGAGVFLDDLTPDDVGAALEARVRPVEPTAAALLRALLGR